MTSSTSVARPVPMRLGPLLLGVFSLLTAAALTRAADVSYQTDPRALLGCSAYADYFPYMITTTDCPVRDLCITRKRCCKNRNETNLDKCLDITSFSCDTAAMCANYSEGTSRSSFSTNLWYPETQDGGASLMCCQAGTTTTEAPAVPPLDSSSLEEVSQDTDLPPASMCDDTTSTACTVMSMFAPIVRAFCQNPNLSMYTDAYINENVPRMCCLYTAAPLNGNSNESVTAGKVACGSNLLDLPLTGEYHCMLDLRGATKVCCNGRIEDHLSSSDGTGSAASSGQSRVFTYISHECLFNPDTNGNSAPSPAMSVTQRLTVAVLSVMAAYLCT
ncbi:hypothetical protein MNV84_02042 [Leishmania braziliensis]|nr:hypothetical protein MNV84_02042 [Leishmania braziliensis]